MRNQIVWRECQSIMASPVVILGQANNVSTPSMAELRHKLRGQNLHLRFPKPGVLRAFLRQSQWPALEDAVVGPTFCAISSGAPSELKAALRTMQGEKNVVLLGGKMLGRPFTIEGVQEIVGRMPRLDELQAQLVGVLQSPGQQLVGTCELGSRALHRTLEQHAASGAGDAV